MRVAAVVKSKPKRKPKRKGRHLRSFEMGQYANARKETEIREVFAVYVPLLVKTAAWQYRRLLQGEGVWNSADPKHLVTALSERYKRSANNQACETLSSWAALVQIKVRKILANPGNGSEKETARNLMYVNAARHWFTVEPDGTYLVPASKLDGAGKWARVAGVFDAVSVADMKLLRRIVKHVRNHKVSLPDFSKTRTMKLDGIVAQWQTPTKAHHFDYWLNFSTLTSGKPVKIPLKSTRHAEERAGEWTNTVQITVSREGKIIIRLIKDATPTVKRVPAGGVIGLDFGLRSLFATSEGDLMGRGFYPWLLAIDVDLMRLTKELQRNRVKPTDSKRYRAMQNRIREHARNEINRVLNRTIDLYDPSVLVVEELDFRDACLSRRLNRILTRVGRAQVKQKLRDLSQDTGVTIIETPAAYSSQECASCHYVDNRNRKNEVFRCRFCGRKGHADIEGSRTVRSRHSWSSATLGWPRARILEEIDTQFEKQWGINPRILRTKGRRKPAISTTRPHADGLNTTPNSGRRVTENTVEPHHTTA